jgi:hypothetical protein
MFHATSGMLARLAHRSRDKRLTREQHIAAVNGWQVRRVAAGTYRYRDPRFDHLTAPQATRAPARTGGDRHG